MTKETRHVKRRVADEICHDTVITDMDGAFASRRRCSAPTSKCARVADVANSGADTTRSSARNQSSS